MAEYLSYRESAKFLGKSVVTIKRWRRNGMPMLWEVRDGQRYRVVEKQVLQAWWRQRLAADPVWRHVLRRRIAEREDASGDEGPR
ncbi:hypothetical protein GCM10010489_11200 [Microbacterium saperdae]|uniref:Helix-turn-helix protein n=1 Tax=Microbacterium saperdae TaxID=69368 RepID=A0A543BQW8_9MICO|nr:hypothetical protein FB560_2896 [Microbacterium saperdae]GGM41942.1 hypothetical protein GCM10010489_11200 [Microbacterium saperdae]